MNRVLPPVCVSDALPLNSNIKNNVVVPRNSYLRGKIGQNGNHVWLWLGSTLEVFANFGKTQLNPVPKELISSCNFGSFFKETQCSIISVKEFHSTVSRSKNSLQLLVSVQISSSGLLCLYDVLSSQILRAIQLPQKAECIEVICSSGGATAENLAICHELRFMFGIVALGMCDGSVYLVDLALDEKKNYLSSEEDSSELLFLSENLESLVHMRETALKNRKHLCIHLNEYRHFDSKQIDIYSIACLKYIRELGSLIIGYTNGCFQLWNAKTMAVDFNFSVDSLEYQPIPVINFIYQEPENDPKNFCYLWAVRSQTHSACSDVASALLLSITYGQKKWIPNYGILYQDFNSCIPRFEHIFTCDPYNSEDSSTIASRVICSYTLHNDNFSESVSRYSDESLQDEEGYGQEYGRCLFLWEAFPNDMACESKYFFAIFDINQWYPAQMPASICLKRLELCSFYGAFSLDEIMKRMGPDMIMDLHVEIKSIKRFNGANTDEMHFYPLSLSFDVTSLTESYVMKLNYLGLQEKMLYHLQDNGPNCLAEPNELARTCQAVGLNLKENDRASPVLYSIASQREFLLSIALENNLIAFLLDCVQVWATADYSFSGITLKFLMDWAWKKVNCIKKTIDNICIPLFNCSGVQLDSVSIEQLYSNLSYLKHLAVVFTYLKDLQIPNTEQGLREIDSRQTATELIISYLKIILWCHQVGLLPDNIEGEEFGENEIAFPTSIFDKMYAARRQEIKKISSTIQETDLLLIDGLIQNMDESVVVSWENDRGCKMAPAGFSSRLYPPPGIHSMLSIYLVPGVSLQEKHDLFLYMLLDLAELLAYKYSHIVEKLMEFPAAFNMEASRVSLIQAFWLLDHCMFEDSMMRLLNPGINIKDLMPWQQTRIIKSLLYQGENDKALKYCMIRRAALISNEDIKLFLTVLLANGLVVDAFNYQRSVQDDKNVEDLLLHFYLGCHQTKNLNKLLQLPLSMDEEKLLVKYLESCSDNISHELLVMYYLQKGKLLEAYALNEELNKSLFSHGKKSKERAETRNAIVEKYISILPSVQRNMILGFGKLKTSRYSVVNKEVERPVPLSAIVKPSKLNVTSQATIISSVMDKVDETLNNPDKIDCPTTPFRSKKSKTNIVSSQNYPFLCTPSTPKLNKETKVHSVVYPEYVTAKKQDYEDDNLVAVSPQKTTRHYTDVSPFRTKDSSKRRSSILNADFLFILKTPTIHRKSKSSLMDSMSQSMDHSSKVSSTPQSILKARSMLRLTTNPLQTLKFDDSSSSAVKFCEDEEMEDIEKSAEPKNAYSETPSTPKLLRFDLSDDHESTSPRNKKSEPHDKSSDSFDVNKKVYPKEASPLLLPKSPPASSGEIMEDSDIIINYNAHNSSKTVETTFSTSSKSEEQDHSLVSTEIDNSLKSPKISSVSQNIDDDLSKLISDKKSAATEEVSIKTTKTSEVTESVDEIELSITRREREVSFITDDASANKSLTSDENEVKNISENNATRIDSPPEPNILDSVTQSDEDIKTDVEPTLHLSSSESEVDENSNENKSPVKPESIVSTKVDKSLNRSPEKIDNETILEEYKSTEASTQRKIEIITPEKNIVVTPSITLSCRSSLRSASAKSAKVKSVEIKESKSRKSVNVKEHTKTEILLTDKFTHTTQAVKESEVSSEHVTDMSNIMENPDDVVKTRRLTRRSNQMSGSTENKVFTMLKSSTKKSALKQKDKNIDKEEEIPKFTFSAAKIRKSPNASESEIADVVTPVNSFIFSPPLTRSRTHRRLSNQSTTSQNDSILIEPLQEMRNDSVATIFEESIEQPTASASKARISRSRKKKIDDGSSSSQSSTSQSLINFASPALDDDLKPPKRSRKKATNVKSRYLIRTRRSVRLE